MDDKVLTKAAMINYLNENIGLSKRECHVFFEAFLKLITDELINKKDVKIVNFGIFKVMKKNQELGGIQKPKNR